MPSVQTLIARLFLVALIGMLGFFAWQTQAEPQTKFNRLTHRLMHPLDTRVRYRIGEIDPRFGLSHDKVARLTQEAVDIWTQGTGRQWFVYDRHAWLTIRMIYDERQATSQLQMDAENKIDQQLLDQKTSR